MSIKFEKKIIIGSITSFLLTAIGVIAIFFPNLFNLEKKSINIYQSSLENIDDVINLYEFLYKNQGRIVDIDINYTETSSYELDFNDSGEARISVFDFENGKKGKNAIGEVDINKMITVTSDYISLPFVKNLFRENGGFFLWLRKNSGNVNNDTADEKFLQVIIPVESNGNKLYLWSFDESQTPGALDSPKKMIFSGRFFINKFIKSEKYVGRQLATPSEWDETYCGGDTCEQTELVVLDPLDAKELETGNY